jgi:tetratricopeptide (TPR) repeat protein
MERQAERGRELVMSNDCATAATVFQKLTERNTISRTLYGNELGTALFLSGQWQDAKRAWSMGLEDVELFFDPKTEKKALSLFGAEARKVYKGDPYERATLCLLLGLIYLDDSDYDNAMAMFKNASLHEFDSSDPKYPSDFALLQALEARCHRLRGEEDLCAQSIAAATRAFKASHPFFSPHLSQLRQANDGAATAAKDKTLAAGRQVYLSQATAAQKNLTGVETRFSETVPDAAYVDPLLKADYNVLFLIWAGHAPYKQRTGKYGESTVWQLPSVGCLPDRYEAYLDGDQTHGFDAIACVAEITEQAVSQRGRQMSDVLREKAATKDKAHKFAGSCFDSANDIMKNAKGEAAMVAAPIAAGLLVVGGVSKVFAWNVDPRADIRVWRTLPSRLLALPMTLPSGSHTVTLEGFDFIMPRSKCTIRLAVADPARVQVHVVRVCDDGQMRQVAKGGSK